LHSFQPVFQPLRYWRVTKRLSSEFGKVRDLHLGAVPLDLLAHARVLGQVAEEHEFRELGAVFETGRRVGAAVAHGVEEILERMPGAGQRTDFSWKAPKEVRGCVMVRGERSITASHGYNSVAGHRQ
jgi:hypothetical protein